MGPALPYLLIAWLVSLIAVGGGAWIKATSAASASCKVEKAEMVAAAQAEKDMEITKTNKASAALEAAQAKTRIKYRTIRETVDRVVEKPVYHAVCLDDDGLRLANAALVRAGAHPGQPDATLPRPDPPR